MSPRLAADLRALFSDLPDASLDARGYSSKPRTMPYRRAKTGSSIAEVVEAVEEARPGGPAAPYGGDLAQWRDVINAAPTVLMRAWTTFEHLDAAPDTVWSDWLSLSTSMCPFPQTASSLDSV